MLPVLLLTFFQWSLHDNWLSTFISVITFLLLISAFLYPSYLILQVVRQHGSAELEEPAHQLTLGGLIGPFRTRRYYYFTAALLLPFLRSCFVSFGKKNGFIQVVGLLVLEVLYFSSLLILRPGHTRRSDVLEIFLGLIRIITTAALLPFAREKLTVAPIPRTGVGIGIAIFMCVGIVVIAINVLLDILPWKVVWWNVRGQKEVVSSSDDSEKDIEKDLQRDESKESKHLGTPEEQHDTTVAALPSSTGLLANHEHSASTST